MKKLLLLILIISFSCESNNEQEIVAPEPTCYAVYSTSNASSTALGSCDARIVITLIEKSKWDAQNFSNRDEIVICVTNPEYKLIDFRLGQIYCNLDDFSILND